MNGSLWNSTPRWLGLSFVIGLTLVLAAETGFTLLSVFWLVVEMYGELPDWVDMTTAAVALLLAAIAGLAYGLTLALFFRRRRLLFVGIGYAVPLLVAGLAVYFVGEAIHPPPDVSEYPWDEIVPYVATPLWWIPMAALVVVSVIEIVRRIRRNSS